MKIREADHSDNLELQQLQAQCPQGASLIVSTVYTPDFFARVKAYDSYKVYVICDDNKIIGSGSCALRNAIVNGRIRRVGYEFQYFTSPDYRRRKVAKRLRRQIEQYMIQQNVYLSYALVMEGNEPSMHLFEKEGFKIHRKLIMPAIVIRKQMKVASEEKIRPATRHDFSKIAQLLNTTWSSREFYEPITPEALSDLIQRIPGFSQNDLFVMEDKGEILACAGSWDWSRVMQVTVKALSMKLKITGLMLTITRILSQFPKPGVTMKQMMLILMGYKDPLYLAALIRTFNNDAHRKGIEQIFCACEPGDVLLKSMKGLFRVNTALHLYIKPLAQNFDLVDRPVYVNNIDL